jgi:hypothetical protein
MLSVNSPCFVFQSSPRKKGENGPDRNRGSVGHLARQGIVENQLRMRTQAALTETRDQIACALKQLAEKSTGGGPADSHDAPGDACDNQRGHQLLRSDPGADGGTQFNIAHSHAAQVTKNAEKQRG